ncbi:MAG: hypothetical protein WKF76_01145 [Nocardioidaceae bacterium]
MLVAALDPLVGDESSREGFRTAQERFANAWVNVVGRYDRSTPVVGFAQEVVALVGVDDNESARESVDALVRAVSGDGGGGRRSFSTGVSRVVETAALIGCGYEQARRAVHVGRQLHGTSAVAHFDDLGAYRLLSLIEDAGELRSFVGEVLHELADEDDPEAADMRATLRARFVRPTGQRSGVRRSDESESWAHFTDSSDPLRRVHAYVGRTNR